MALLDDGWAVRGGRRPCCRLHRPREDNRTVQAEVNRRQQFINQSVQLGRINEVLIRALAAAAVSNKDDRLRDLLAEDGITIDAAGEPVASASGPAEKNAPATTGKTP